MDSSLTNASPAAHSNAALIVAHPGHELRIHHWMETRRPLYFCLTDGSGKEGIGRMDSTTKVLRDVGATPGSIYGRLTDKQVYQALLAKEFGVFTESARDLTKALIAHQVEIIAGDAPEGLNPTHDLCRFIIEESVVAVEQVTGRQISNHEFVLDSPPTDCPRDLKTQALWLRLDEAAMERKLQAAMGYLELRGETEEGLRLYGKQAFSVECLRPSTARRALQHFETEPPAYERFGREGVERFGKKFGQYEQVITFQEHVKPAVQAIRKACQELIAEYESGSPVSI